jgi:acyl dehydratase
MPQGAWWETGRRAVTAADIDGFAALTGDRFAIHMEDAAARALGFPGRVAHGLLVLSLIDGLKNAAPVQPRAIASLGWDWTFSAPVLIGDTVGARIEVVEARPTRDPARGILRLRFDVTREDGATVQRGDNLLMVQRRA